MRTQHTEGISARQISFGEVSPYLWRKRKPLSEFVPPFCGGQSPSGTHKRAGLIRADNLCRTSRSISYALIKGV